MTSNQDDAAKNDEFVRFVEDKYAIRLIEDKRDLVYRPIYVCTNADNKKTSLFSHVSGEPKTVMLAAVVLEEYSLKDTDYPVTVQLSNGETELMGSQTTRTKRTWSAVLLPGHQHSVEDKVLFEPPVTHIAVARELFPDISDEDSKRGITEITTDKSGESWLCVESPDGTAKNAVCPLGFALKHSSSKYELREGPYHGKSMKYIVLTDRDTRDALQRFRRDTKDTRPIVTLTNMYANVKIMDDNSGSFVLGMKLGVYYYDV